MKPSAHTAPAPRTLSLTTKLCVAATALCVLCVAATSVVLGAHTAASASEQAEQQATLAARDAAGSVAAEIGRSFEAVQTLAATLQGLKASGQVPTREQLDAMSREILSQRTEFIGTYSIWEPNALDGRDADFAGKGPAHDATGRYIAYWNRGAGSIAVEPLLDYEKQGANDWYAIPRSTRKSALIEPCIYPVAGKDVLMTTLAAPILIDGQFVGMAGADLPLQSLSERMSSMQPVPGSRVSLLSSGGLYVATQDAARLAKKAEDLPSDVLASIANGQTHRHEGQDGWVHLFQPVQVLPGLAPWSVQVSYPADAALVEEMAAASGSLKGQADELLRAVSTFDSRVH
jgi:methyl-accepting chemotaxis protein